MHGLRDRPDRDSREPSGTVLQRREWEVTGAMLLPARAEVARHLERYRAWERLMLASPDNRAVRGNFENTGYTLCVLMGERCAREAVDAAELYLNADGPRERAGRRPCPTP